jgi:CelD/BcsL family acetyltransferase involved in cellulose biosynthesis
MTTDYHNPLVHPDDAAGTWQALLTALPKLARWPLRSVTLDLLSVDAACRSVLPTVAEAAGFEAVDEVTSAGTVIPLAATWEQYLERLEPHDRKEVRRKLRKAEDRGAARFVVNNTQLSDRYALQGTFDLMERAGGGKGRKAKWMFRPHFETAAPALSKDGRLTVYELYLNDALAASLIALTQGRQQILWCGAIDRDLREWSPGIVLFAMVFRRAISLGQPSIDLLRGQYPYKYKMGATDSPMHRVTLRRKN